MIEEPLREPETGQLISDLTTPAVTATAEPIRCRFCGGTPRVVTVTVHYRTPRRTGAHEIRRVLCYCGAHGKCRPDDASAIASWNEPWQALPQGAELLSIADHIREVVAEAKHDGRGFWHTCSGCHETEDGHDVGHYPYSRIFEAKLGGGCSECGGIGATWDTIDYSDMADFMLAAGRAEEYAAIEFASWIGAETGLYGTVRGWPQY